MCKHDHLSIVCAQKFIVSYPKMLNAYSSAKMIIQTMLEDVNNDDVNFVVPPGSTNIYSLSLRILIFCCFKTYACAKV